MSSVDIYILMEEAARIFILLILMCCLVCVLSMLLGFKIEYIPAKCTYTIREHKIELPIQMMPPMDNGVTFYEKDIDKKLCKKGNCGGYIVGHGNTHPKQCDFGEQIDWTVVHKPGADGSCSDLLWHSLEPRMILIDNTFKCDGCGTKMVNGPVGYNSDV